MMLRHRTVVRVRDLFSVGESLGHTYTVRVSWTFSGEGKANNGSAAGEAFTF